MELEKDIQIPKQVFDSSYPLLERLRSEASGTHKHSLNVSNICESVAIELGRNKDLMKCVGLFHDIGKLYEPRFFSENQPIDENPHDNIDPYISFLLITRHISEGVALLFKHKEFPKEVMKL